MLLNQYVIMPSGIAASPFIFTLQDTKINPWRKQPGKPRFKSFVSLSFCDMKAKIRANYFMCLIINTKDKIAVRLIMQTGGIAQGRKILANKLRLVMINLKFQPFIFPAMAA